MLVFINRAFSSSVVAAFTRKNPALWIVLAITAIVLGTSQLLSPVRGLFEFSPVSTADLVLILAGAGTVALLEFAKAISRTRPEMN
jgi:Ca2+-transporting ATPase